MFPFPFPFFLFCFVFNLLSKNKFDTELKQEHEKFTETFKNRISTLQNTYKDQMQRLKSSAPDVGAMATSYKNEFSNVLQELENDDENLKKLLESV